MTEKMSPMDRILANACPSHRIEDGDPDTSVGQVDEFYIETHCVAWLVKAKVVWSGKDSSGIFAFKYEILSMEASSA